MKYIYKLMLGSESGDITIGYYSSRNKAFESAEHMIGRSGQRVLVTRKRDEISDIVGNEGAFYVVKRIWVE